MENKIAIRKRMRLSLKEHTTSIITKTEKNCIKNQNETTDEKNEATAATQKLCDSKVYKDSDIVFAFMSYGTEIGTTYLLEKILSDNKVLALPRTTNNNMDFYFINSDVKTISDLHEQLEIGDFGILVPKPTLQVVNVKNLTTQDFWKHEICTSKNNTKKIPNILFIVPGLAFDLHGNRLGKGKGFYDKYLSQFIRLAENTQKATIINTDNITCNNSNSTTTINNIKCENSIINTESENIIEQLTYYPKMTTKFHIALVGFCFDFQIIDAVPTEITDIKMTHIATNNNFYTIK